MDKKNTFSWSKSRDEIFKDCKRRYFFNHYGHWGGWEENADRRIRQIYILKNLQSRHMWLGSIVHEYIGFLLDRLRYEHEIDLYTLLGNLRKAMKRDFENSEKGLYTKYPKFNGRQYGLFEHEYHIFVSNDEWKEIFDTTEKCVANFFNSDLFRYIKSISTDNWLPIERLQTFDFEGTPVYVKIDFALEDKGRLFIFDWKTGKVRDVEMDVQLACYGLYATHRWDIELQNIICKKYNLLIDRVDDYEINHGRIEKIKEYMRSSISSMKELLYDKENNIAREEDFDITDDDNKCKSCNFRKVCHKWD